MKEIEITLSINGIDHHLFTECYVDIDYNFEIHRLDLFNEETEEYVISFKTHSPLHAVPLSDFIQDESLCQQIDAALTNEVDEGILAW